MAVLHAASLQAPVYVMHYNYFICFTVMVPEKLVTCAHLPKLISDSIYYFSLLFVLFFSTCWWQNTHRIHLNRKCCSHRTQIIWGWEFPELGSPRGPITMTKPRAGNIRLGGQTQPSLSKLYPANTTGMWPQGSHPGLKNIPCPWSKL